MNDVYYVTAFIKESWSVFRMGWLFVSTLSGTPCPANLTVFFVCFFFKD